MKNRKMKKQMISKKSLILIKIWSTTKKTNNCFLSTQYTQKSFEIIFINYVSQNKVEENDFFGYTGNLK